ncbi:germ cell nuclear acidic protein [Stigmatopora nigra]
MNDETRSLFERVAPKMIGSANNRLERTENKNGKQGGPSKDQFGNRSGSSICCLSDDEEDKENQSIKSKVSVTTEWNDSSDDDFDQCLVRWATPKPNLTSKKPCSAAKTDHVLAVSSDNNNYDDDDDDSGDFEKFLQRVKTPTSKPQKIPESESDDSLKNFIVDDDLSEDDFILPKSSSKVSNKNRTPAALNKIRRPLSDCASSLLSSDSEDEDDSAFWRTCHTKPKSLNKTKKTKPASGPAVTFSVPRLPHRPTSSLHSTTRTLSAPSKVDNSSDSDEEFMSLLDRLRKKNVFAGTTCSPITNKDVNFVSPPPPPVKPRVKPKSLGAETPAVKTPGKTTKPTVSQTEPRHGPISRLSLCKTPGCFLETLSNPATSYCSNFKKKKEELTTKLYSLYNTSVFDLKLPTNMSVTWNKKMRKTAGYCVTGQERGGGNRYARIELSEKVCDSADRLRDTLIHEMCHAATWLINGVRDGHGRFWRLYAHKSTLVHPELPVVTRCHSYDIKFKFQYKCTKCQNTIGRHSKSLDTQKFACALCTGKLVLLTPAKPRPPTPFAKYVKEHYGSVRQELVDQKHGEIMRKLSVDFAAQTKL